MPVVLRYKGLKFFFYSNEGPRPHVHIESQGIEVQIWLDTMELKRPSRSKTLNSLSLKTAKKFQKMLLAIWEEYFEEENQ